MPQKGQPGSPERMVKTAIAPPLESDFFEIAAGDPEASARTIKLNELFKDKEFLPETLKVRDGLLELQNRDHRFFNRFFRTADYPAAFSSSMMDRLISEFAELSSFLQISGIRWGGAGSLALTFLWPNSLLTGNLTGTF